MRNKTIIKLTIIALCIAAVCVYALWPQTYGNDLESIEKIISKQDSVMAEVSVFDVKDIEDYRVAGFFDIDSSIEDAVMDVAVFQKNKDGNYVFLGLGRRFGALERYHILYFRLNDYIVDKPILHVFVSNNPKLAKVEYIIYGGNSYYADVEKNPSITFLEFPGYAGSAEYNYYDSNGKMIS